MGSRLGQVERHLHFGEQLAGTCENGVLVPTLVNDENLFDIHEYHFLLYLNKWNNEGITSVETVLGDF